MPKTCKTYLTVAQVTAPQHQRLSYRATSRQKKKMGLFYQPSQLLNELSPLTLTLVLTVAALALLGLALLKRVLYPTHDPREPPVLRPRIPLIGHAISIAREGGGYYERL